MFEVQKSGKGIVCRGRELKCPKGGSREAEERERDIAVPVDSSATESRERLKEQQKMLNA